jgi:flagellar hook-length control protein FliK
MEDMRIPIGRDPESGYPNAHHAADVRSIPLASAEPADISAKEASVGPAPGNLVPDLQSTAGLSEKPIAVLIPESNAASQGSKEETRSPQLENEKISAVKASSPPELRNSFEHQPIGYGRKSETLENPSVVAAEPAINDTKPLVPFFHTQSSGPTHHISAQVDSSLSTPELARSVAIQVAEKVAGSVGPEIDLALNPEELGRFRILLKPSETGISVTILADRPETLDLMRRHIDALSQEFRSIGYSTTSFSFGQGAKQDQKSSHPNEAMSRGPDSENNPTELPTGARLKMRPDGSLDLKL